MLKKDMQKEISLYSETLPLGIRATSHKRYLIVCSAEWRPRPAMRGAGVRLRMGTGAFSRGVPARFRSSGAAPYAPEFSLESGFSDFVLALVISKGCTDA